MEFQIPVDTIFTNVFGIAYSYFPSFKVGEMPAEEDSDVYSQLGLPVQEWMAFVGRDNYRKRVNGELQEVSLKGIYLPFTSVASFYRAKRETETWMGGEDFVTEEFGHEPWNITIQGLILKDDQKLVTGESSVEDQVKALMAYADLADSIGVRGKMFELLKINEVKISNISFPKAREYNALVVKPFEMTLRSVKPIELIDV